MIATMKRSAAIIAILFMVLASPVARASSSSDEEQVAPDARLLGYADEKGTLVKVDLEPSSGAVNYIAMIILGVLCLSVLFVNAKRTHLD